MDGKDQHGNCSYDDQVSSTTSVLSDGGPQNPMQTITTDNWDEIELNEIGMHREVQKKRRFEAYRRSILRRRARERTEAKKKAAAAASSLAPPLAAAAVAAQPPQGHQPKLIALSGAVASDVENHNLHGAVEKMNALGESSGKKILEGMKQMLTVTTIEDGQEDKKVDGFLYKYDKSGRIFIVCFCHGVFLSPTDFVKHANHTDWSNPMKHIAVSLSPPPPL
ncbi:hypothetical protein NL676_029138 [Syzygium grande]|nr:hypothetical protein NL676_029138 [Syzygium grande]